MDKISSDKIKNIIDQFKPLQEKMIAEKGKCFKHLLRTSLPFKLVNFSNLQLFLKKFSTCVSYHKCTAPQFSHMMI